MMAKGRETRLRILDAAQSVVLEKGFSGTSIDEIIDAAELTKGGFFYHFRGKADLARALMERYLEQDEAFFSAIIEHAEELTEDPLQRVFVFLKLYAEALSDLPGLHPGCLVASFAYESQQFDPAVQALAASAIERWRDLFEERLAPAIAEYRMNTKVEVRELASMLTATMEGGIILSRVMNDPQILVQQILQYRNYIRLLFADPEKLSAMR